MKFPFDVLPDAEFDVAGFGTNAVDYLIRLPAYPEFESKVEISSYERQSGGEVASTLAGLARLGCRTAYAGRFGSDEAGKFGIESLAGEGVDTSYATRAECATQVGFILIDESTGERTVLWHRDERLGYSASEAPLELVRRARILHMTPHDTAACIAMAAAAREARVIVSLDADNVFGETDQLLPLVDILAATTGFVQEITGTNNLRQGLSDISSSFGCKVSAVTLGSAGSLIRCGESFIETSAFEVPGGCRDTTGAGDAFRAGLLYGVITGESVETAAQIANAVAALKCRRDGARTGLPDTKELTSLLEQL